MRGCFFHLCQNVFRKIQSEGLKPKYEADIEFALLLKMIPAIAFVPEDKVYDSFVTLINTVQFPRETLTVVDYFEKAYIGRPDRNKPPLFPIKVWNCYKSVTDDLPRTNNHVEGWHRGFNSSLGSHPNVWKFIEAIKKENSHSVFILNQVLGGVEPPYKKKKYKSVDEKLKRIVSNFNDDSIDSYLKGVASTFSF